MQWLRAGLSCALLLAGCAHPEARPPAPPSPAPPSAPAPSPAPQAEAPAQQEGATEALADIPADYLAQAHAALTEDAQASARALTKAAALMELEAERAAAEPPLAEVGGRVRRVAGELQQLARGVEGGQVREPAQLDAPLARAHLTLADYHLARAQLRWREGARQQAGEELAASARYLARSAAAAGREAEREVEGTVRDSRQVARELARGAGALSREVERVLASLSEELEGLGREVEEGVREGRQESAPSSQQRRTP